MNFQDVMVIDAWAKPESGSYGWGFVGLGVALFLPLVLVGLYAYIKDKRDRKAAEAAYLAGKLPGSNPPTSAPHPLLIAMLLIRVVFMACHLNLSVPLPCAFAA